MADDIDAYIARFPVDVRRILKTITAIIRQAAPGAAESVSYGIPTFKANGSFLIYFAGFKAHISLYPIAKIVAFMTQEMRGGLRKNLNAKRGKHDRNRRKRLGTQD